MTQLTLELADAVALRDALAVAQPSPPPAERPLSERQQWDRHHVKNGHAPYHPKKCRDIILANCNESTYTSFGDLCRATDMHPWLIDWMLDMLIKWGRLEKHELYFGPHTSPDRLTKPPMDGKGSPKYQGFQWGYRKTKEESRKEVNRGTMS